MAVFSKRFVHSENARLVVTIVLPCSLLSADVYKRQLPCRLLKVAQQLDQLFTDSLLIRSVGVEKDPGRSIMQLQPRDLVTAHVELSLIHI